MTSCTCEKCVCACTVRPGWFLPGEVATAALALGMSEQEFFDRYCAVDWWAGLSDVFVVAPALDGHPTGHEYPGDPGGRCSLLGSDNLCSIHAVKPYECREYMHDQAFDVGSKRKLYIVDQWRAAQDEPRRLLGREPIAAEEEAW